MLTTTPVCAHMGREVKCMDFDCIQKTKICQAVNKVCCQVILFWHSKYVLPWLHSWQDPSFCHILIQRDCPTSISKQEVVRLHIVVNVLHHFALFPDLRCCPVCDHPQYEERDMGAKTSGTRLGNNPLATYPPRSMKGSLQTPPICKPYHKKIVLAYCIAIS